MSSNFRRIGDFIRQVNIRNSDLSATNLLGINIDKYFMPSVANIVGTDLSNYKKVKFNQFACNRMHVGRDMRLPIALSDSYEDFIVSPAYDVFEISDIKELNPEYLMMWFSRKEFDRNAWFYTDSDVRGGLSWDDFCNMKLPVPSIEKQKEIVREYKTVTDRIELNNKLIQKLEGTAQAIYKHWFVDFEFPDENGKPYKSSGGEMIESEMGMIPKGWRVGRLGEIVDLTLGGDWGKDEMIDNFQVKVFCIRGTDIPNSSKGMKNGLPIRYILSQNLNSRKLKENDIIIELSGGSPTQSTGRSLFITSEIIASIGEELICSNFCRIIRADLNYSHFIFATLQYLYKKDVFYKYENSSNGVKNLDLDGILNDEKVALPLNDNFNLFSNILSIILSNINALGNQIEFFAKLNSTLLAKLSRTEE